MFKFCKVIFLLFSFLLNQILVCLLLCRRKYFITIPLRCLQTRRESTQITLSWSPWEVGVPVWHYSSQKGPSFSSKHFAERART